ncbi:hypothetical protein N867_15245 [Actinotalea fermentans ATCC 43279 = JCM 9966 = DSM 3133]|nr:hypothetical protein N867_15245 [Actinotalea fermentans ATCC 43279 = JCM 9966 = DSM 3133]
MRPDGLVDVLGTGGSSTAVAPHGRIDGWTLMATLGDAAILETLGIDEGAILLVGPEGTRRCWPTSLAWTGRDQGNQPSHEDVLPGTPDVLRAQLLAGPDDPDPAAIARAVAPIRRLADGAGERPHTFVGSPGCADVVPVYYDSLRATTRVNPVVVAPEARAAIEAQELGEGLVGGWLPAVRIVYPVADGSRWEQLLFAAPNASRERSQPVWYRFCHVGADGALLAVRYVDTYLPYPVGEEPPAETFYAALAELDDFWSERLPGGVQVDLPEPRLADFVRHSFALEMITRQGDAPRYGVVDRIYGAPEHDGFQDTLTSTAAAYLAWGRSDVAGRYLDQYLADVVRPDGSLDYRGPEIGQYGRMLTVLADHATQTGDWSLLRRHGAKVDAIVGILLARRAAGLRRPAEDPAHGLIAGRHEADISFDTPSLGTHDYEQPYLSNSAEGWRGLRDLGRAWQRLGRVDGDETRVVAGRSLVRAAESLRTDLLRAVEASWIERSDDRVLPIVAGSTHGHLDAPYRSRPESFDDNRVWHELFGSGALPADVVREIVEGGARRGDTAFGIFGNRKHAVAFTAHGVAYGLLQHDLVREYLLLLRAHLLHMHTRGTWTAVECSDLDRDRGEHWPYCAPAQMTIPLLLRWLLVFEDPLAPRVWLARAVPRDWLRRGQTVAVSGVPTAYGPVGFRIESTLGGGIITAEVDRPAGATFVLRLRAPQGWTLDEAEVDGRDVPVVRGAEDLELPRGSGIVRVAVRYRVE